MNEYKDVINKMTAQKVIREYIAVQTKLDEGLDYEQLIEMGISFPQKYKALYFALPEEARINGTKEILNMIENGEINIDAVFSQLCKKKKDKSQQGKEQVEKDEGGR